MKLSQLIKGESVACNTPNLSAVKDENGVIWYQNSKHNIIINSESLVYQVINNELKSPKLYKTGSNGVNQTLKLGKTYRTLGLSTIISMVFGVQKPQKTTVILKDIEKGLIEGNFKFGAYTTSEYKNYLKRLKEHKDSVNKTLTSSTESLVLKVDSFKHLIPELKLVTGKTKFICDDGSVFESKDVADWHQQNVDKGKANAEIVVSYRGGYELAEKIYLQDVKYPSNIKPYANFVDILGKSEGVAVLNEPDKFIIKSEKEREFVDRQEATEYAMKIGAFKYLESKI